MSEEMIQPAEVRRGDVIGTKDINHHPFLVEDINGPQPYGVTGTEIRQWTFEGPDTTTGELRTANFREGVDLVRRYRRAEE